MGSKAIHKEASSRVPILGNNLLVEEEALEDAIGIISDTEVDTLGILEALLSSNLQGKRVSCLQT